MATREAGIKLTLNSATLIAGMDGVSAHAKATGKKIKSGLSAGFDGVGKEFLKGGKDALKGLGSGIKDVVSSAATLGGALSIGEGIHGAIQLTEVYKDLAFEISNGTGKAVEWTEVQADIEGAAGRWKRKNEEVADSYKELFDQTGDLQFTADAVDAVAMAATASGKSMATLGSIAGVLNEKFGVAGDQMEDALASVLELGSKGGVSVEEMGEKLGILGASAKQMGFDGVDGFKQMVGMMNVGDNVLGSFKKNLKAVTELTDTFGNTDKLKKIEKDLHVKLTDKGGAARGDALDTIIAKSGGKKEILSKVFTGDTLKLVSEFGRTYNKVFDETSGNAKQKTQAALDAFHKALSDAGKTSLTAADLEKQAQERLKDPARQFDDAMNKFKSAFTRPEMLAAMDKLAAVMPRVANGMVKLVDFVFNHPMLAGAGLVGAKVGGGALQAGMGKLAENAASGLVGIGKSMGKDIAAEFASGATNWGKAAGGAIGIAGAAAIAYEIGKSLIDARVAEKEASQKATTGAVIEAANAGKDPVKLQAAADKLTDDYTRQLRDQREAGPTDAIFNGLAGLVDSDYKPGEETQMAATLKALTEVNAQLNELAKHSKAAAGGAEDLASGAKKAGQAASAAAGYFGNVAGSPSDSTGNGTSKGPPTPGGAKPGYLY